MCPPLELPICKGSVSWLSFISDLQSASVLCSTIMVINVALLLLYSTALTIFKRLKIIILVLHDSVTNVAAQTLQTTKACTKLLPRDL